MAASVAAFRSLSHKPRDLPLLKEKLEDLQDKCDDQEERLDNAEARVRMLHTRIKLVKAKRRGITLDFNQSDDEGTGPERTSAGSATERRGAPPLPKAKGMKPAEAAQAPPGGRSSHPNYLRRPAHKADPRALEGVEANRRSNELMMKQLRLLETKLHNLKRGESDIDSQRKNLRITINMLRQEHLMRKEVFEGLVSDMAASKRDMEAAMEHSNTVYEEREKAIEYLVRAEEVAEQEEQHFQEEMATLQEMLEKERVELEHIRDDVSSNRRRTRPGKGSPTTGSRFRRRRGSGGSAVGRLGGKFGKLRSAAHGIGHMKGAPAEQEAPAHEEHEEVVYTLDQLSEAFAKVRELSGIEDVSELVSSFIEREDANFRAFNFIQRMNQDCDRVQEELEEVQAAVKKYRETQGFQDVKRKQMLDSLNDRLVSTLQRSKDYEERHARNEVTIVDMCQRVSSMFSSLRCHEMAGFRQETPNPEDGRRRPSMARGPAPPKAPLHPSVAAATAAGLEPAKLVLDRDESVAALIQQGVSRTTVLPFLGIIEQRTSEVLATFVRRQRAAGALPEDFDVAHRRALPSKDEPEIVQVKAPKLLEPPDTREAAMLEEGDDASDGEIGEDYDAMKPLSRAVLEKQAVLQLKKIKLEIDENPGKRGVKEDRHGLPVLPANVRKRSSLGLDTGMIGLVYEGGGSGTGGAAGARVSPQKGQKGKAGVRRRPSDASAAASAGALSPSVSANAAPVAAAAPSPPTGRSPGSGARGNGRARRRGAGVKARKPRQWG